ncbi:MAG: glycosyl transferase [Spiribacter salinus]|uniref:Glycosyl transferase n=1 Tax=Spiribacter salinus TaxID=1335746 RepID=A0A540VPU6_9GAMM|nr:MAG: glycosyl transferase [Spiribacter salinus]
MSGERRVLVFSEAVTLAHAARPRVVADDLHKRGHEVHLAAPTYYEDLFGTSEYSCHRICSVAPATFRKSLARGARLYGTRRLRSYVQEDLRLIKNVQPDVIIGDFRLSLSVSARVAGTPYLALSNAYWSPYAELAFPVPDLPATRLIGVRAAQWLFDRIRLRVFGWHAAPLNRLRREYGLMPLPEDLRHAYTDGDVVLYADIPDLVRLPGAPPSHEVIGPIAWSPTVELPGWWQDIPVDSTVVYVNLGSSGDTAALPLVLSALEDLDVVALVGTAGAELPRYLPRNCFAARYVPGDQASERSALVVCNGGSPSVHQALMAGKPVLGLPSNLDQFLNMQTVAAYGAGSLLRARGLKVPALRTAIGELLRTRPEHRSATAALQASCLHVDALSSIDQRVRDQKLYLG